MGSKIKGKSVLIVDDAAAFKFRMEDQFLGHGADVHVAASLKSAQTLIERHGGFDISVVDMYIPENDGEADRIQRGEQLAGELRRVNRSGIIIGVSAHMEREPITPIGDLFSAFFFKDDIRDDESSALIFETIESILTMEGAKLPRVFIVHGHDGLLVSEAKNFLQNSLGFPEPVVLRERPDQGRTIIEKFESEASRIDMVVVCMSPDDKFEDGSTRSRQNVIFEAGFFYGQMRRASGRILLLCKGNVDIPTDLSGIVYLDVTNGVEAQGEAIRREFAAAGFKAQR